MFTNKSSQSLNLYMKKEELPTTLCSMCKKWKNSLFMPILQENCIILQQISIILLFWVFWLQYRTLKKFVDTTMGLMKSAEISLIFLKVCWSQYGTQFFVTSIGQVCWREYVAPSDFIKNKCFVKSQKYLKVNSLQILIRIWLHMWYLIREKFSANVVQVRFSDA